MRINPTKHLRVVRNLTPDEKEFGGLTSYPKLLERLRACETPGPLVWRVAVWEATQLFDRPHKALRWFFSLGVLMWSHPRAKQVVRCEYPECGRPSKREIEGKPYCGYHHPTSVSDRRERKPRAAHTFAERPPRVEAPFLIAPPRHP